MARKLSAGIVFYRRRETGIEVLLVHPGGPFWAKKDEGAWSIPKGEYVEGEDPLSVAKREFAEETGSELSGPASSCRRPNSQAEKLSGHGRSKGISMPRPSAATAFLWNGPKVRDAQSFPEADRALWCDVALARRKLLPGQRVLLDELEQRIS
jgi:predicted NUDIX family NTP pyrophosphohydrolase